jgi:hypothetical protein
MLLACWLPTVNACPAPVHGAKYDTFSPSLALHAKQFNTTIMMEKAALCVNTGSPGSLIWVVSGVEGRVKG